MTVRIPSRVRPQLWTHQIAALDVIRRYLSAGSERHGSALIRMPTGTGKSGVIAVTAHYLAPPGHVLVLAPWDALVRQLIDDIEKRFWNRIKLTPPKSRTVARLLPSTADAQLTAAKGKDQIFVGTIAALEDLHRDAPQVYARLARSLAVVMVDEGHYEPAPDWSRAVRELERPVVLLTATPYRNDFKYFHVDPAFRYSYSHEQAEADHHIRRVEFQDEGWTSVAGFCSALLAFTTRTFGNEQCRVIVRCARQETVSQVTNALRARGASVIGIHERFDSRTGEGYVRSVPNPDLADAPQFWVHQFKLMEGIDNPRFRVLAMFEPFRNERSFVQQVGRILRNPSESPTERAWVFSHPVARLRDSWEAYRAYDRDPRSQEYWSPAAFARSLPRQYLDRRFREPFDLDGASAPRDFDYPRTTRVFAVGADFDLPTLARAIEREWNDFDIDMGPTGSPDALTRVHPYIVLRNSPLLLRKAFPEFALGFTVYRRVRSYLFYYDSEGHVPQVLTERSPIEPSSLERLYQGPHARLTSVSLRNTNLGRYDVRRRTLQAYAIGDLAPDLGDHAHFASTATGLTTAAGAGGGVVHRYVGFTNARVRDGAGSTTFDDYKDWLAELADQLDRTTTRSLTVFDRYAEAVRAPANAQAENILLDFDQDSFRQKPQPSAASRPLHVEDLCLTVDRGGRFQLRANDQDYAVQITWRPTKRRYHLDAPELNAAYEAVSPDPRAPSLVAYLNRQQAFRVVPRGSTYSVYARGRFYRPRLALWGRVGSDRFDLLQVLEGVPQLAAIGSEKGDANSTRPHGAGWAVGSLFDFIDRHAVGTSAAPLFAGIDLLVCDDLGTEIADFIAVDSHTRRVIAMHAKAFPQPKPLSASAFHDVSAQAVKNLGYFQPYFVGTPKGLARWSGPWVSPREGTVTRRIRIGNVTGALAWERVRAALRDPDYTREIWLILGRGLSKTALEAARAADRPPAETIQILYSLQSTWSATSSVGARLRVFCSP